MGAAVNVVAHIQSPDLTQSLMLSIRLRWPDANASTVDTEDRLLEAASGADVVLVDQAVARAERFELVRKIRGTFDGALVIVAEHPDEAEMVNSLEAGSDDYLGSPISPMHLVARLTAVLRRVRISAQRDNSVLTCGPLEIKSDIYEAYVNGRELRLTRKEFDVLYQLALAKGSLVTSQALQQLVWESDEGLYLDSLRKYVQRLRKKLHEQGDSDVNIIARRGLGYRLTYTDGARRSTR